MMRIPFRKTEADKRAAAARADLDTARAQLNTVDAEEVAALADGAAYQAWQTKRAEIAAEVERLDRLIAALAAGAEAARAHDEAEAQRRRLADGRKRADELAAHIKADGQRIVTEFLQLVVDAARQALEAKALNAPLPAGETPVPVADILARDAGTMPREDLRSRELDLWVAETTGVVIGDQAAVASDDGVRGQVHVMGGTMRWKCVKRRFRETEYRPNALSDWPGDIFSLVRLPRLDGPGLMFDGSAMTVEAVAALNVAAVSKPANRQPRPVQIELVPIDRTWPPKGEGDVAA